LSLFPPLLRNHTSRALHDFLFFPWFLTLSHAQGFATHNLQAFFSPALPAWYRPFTGWLRETLSEGDAVSDEDRWARLADWKSAPGAREAHPREEHLLPLHVVAGAGGDSGATIGQTVPRGRVLYDRDAGASSMLAVMFD
jgi:aromatic ring-opening dioxygenase catalytic subunit (LigB family)